MGGKVVKNAAGFDLPKFFVGQLGGDSASLRRSPSRCFRDRPLPSPLRLKGGREILTQAANSRFEFDALDIAPEGGRGACEDVCPGAGAGCDES